MTEATRNEGGAGRVVVIVGASSGIGRAVALRCAGQGDTLVLAARRAELLRQLDDEVAAVRPAGPAGPGKTVTVPADVRDPGAAAGIVGTAVSHFGRLDVVVYAAGWNVRKRSIYETTDESWQSIVETNLTGAFSVTRAAVPAMRDRGGGLLVYVSSSGAKRPDQSGVAYQASKAGLAALAHATMEEARTAGVRTTVIYPGLVDTPFIEHRPAPPDEDTLRRALQPEDVAAACAFVMQLPARAHVPELLLYPSRT